MTFLSYQPQLKHQAERDQHHYRSEYPVTGAFHSTRHWLSQLMIDVVNTVWWVSMAGVFGLAFSIPVIVLYLLVQ